MVVIIVTFPSTKANLPKKNSETNPYCSDCSDKEAVLPVNFPT